VMFTKIGELKIKLACNKHAFTVPIWMQCQFQKKYKEKTRWMWLFHN
jgi:hypothetical protein